MGFYESSSLIRRYLSLSKNYNFSDKLPTLTCSELVDVELYSIIAIICKDHINIWYEQITHDKSFIEESLLLISHVVKELEKKFFMIKHELLLLHNIPMIAIKHINDIRRTQKILQDDITSHRTFDEIFHEFQPHPALDSYENECLYLRLIADTLITSFLPPDDLKSECERVIIREILSDFIFKKIIDKLSEPSILFEIIAKLIVDLKKKYINKDIEKKRFRWFMFVKLCNLIIFIWKKIFMSIANSPQFIQNIFDLAGFEFVFEVLELKTEAPYIYTVIRFFLIPCIFVFFGDLILIQFMRFWSQYIFTEQFAVSCFRALRIAIWSDGSVEVSKIQHYKFDNYKIKEYLETELYTIITVLFNNHFFRFNDEIIKTKIKQICSLFDSKVANKHFIFYMLDLILGSIVYEISNIT